MLYGDEKLRQIGKSPLPATRNAARTARKDLASIKRRNRRATRQTLHELAIDTDFEEFQGTVTTYPTAQIRYVMRERRDADNLGALFQWARHKLSTDFKHLSEQDKYYAFKAVLPDSMQGRHALDHIEASLLDLDPYRYGQYSPMTLEDRRRAIQSRDDRARNLLKAQLAKILDERGHAWLNRQLRAVQAASFPRGCTFRRDTGFERCSDCGRLYLGASDEEAFIEMLMRNQHTSSAHARAFRLVAEFA